MEASCRSFSFASCVRGYHVYQKKWKATEGESLSCKREEGSREDPFAVAIVKSGEIVGHVPRSISCGRFLILATRRVNGLLHHWEEAAFKGLTTGRT